MIEIKLIKPTIVGKTTPLKKINLPSRMSNKLAELVGIHFGDGSIYMENKKTNRKYYRIVYCFNIKEKELQEEVKKMFNDHFNIQLGEYTYINKSAVALACSSKELCYFLNENFNIPFGKKNHLCLPKIIKNNKIYLRYFIRGLFKTDGCCFIKKDKGYEYPIIKITTKCKEFSKDIQKSLIGFGFRARINKKHWGNHSGYDVVLHGEKQHRKWFSEIM